MYEATPIPAVTALDRRQWRPHEYPLLWHYVNFARLANSVVTAPGPLQGWFDQPLWRQYSYAPFNARVLENYHSLGFFAAYAAPWNQYHRDPGVLHRLGLTLEYTFALAGPRGELPEYASAELDAPMLAPSSFGAEYLAAVLDQAGALLPNDLRARLTEVARRATRYVLTAEDSWEHARSFSNQFLGALVAARKLARLTGDTELAQLAARGANGVLSDFSASPGYLYENDGAETFGYFFVSLRRLIPLAQEWPDPRWTEVLRRHCAWMSRWMLPEPNRDLILLAGTHHTRTAGRARIGAPVTFEQTLQPGDGADAFRWGHGLGELLAGADDERRFLRLFLPTAAQQDAWRQTWRDHPDLLDACGWSRGAGQYPPVSTLWSYESYAPMSEDWRAARDALPCHPAGPATETLRDEKGNQFVFVRQPRYYTAFAFGSRASVARLGPSFLWLPSGGTVLLGYNAQAMPPGLCWETVAGERGTGRLPALATVRDEDGATEVTVDYPELGLHKTYVLRPDAIDVRVRPLAPHGQAAYERLPLLLRADDQLVLDYGHCAASELGLERGLSAVTRRVTIERQGQAILTCDFLAPVTVSASRQPARDGLVAVELRAQFAPVFYNRGGYRLLV